MPRLTIALCLPLALITGGFTGCAPAATSRHATNQVAPSVPLAPQSSQDCTQIRNRYQASDRVTTAQMQGAGGDEIRTQCEQKGVVIPQG